MPPNFHADTPLAQRMRPSRLTAIIGQEHLLAVRGTITMFGRTRTSAIDYFAWRSRYW